MTKVNKKLTNEEIKQLVDLHVSYKIAEANFKELKEKLCFNIIEGKHKGDAGTVTKTVSERTSVNTSKLLADHPELEALFEEYKEVREVTSITVTNLNRG
jgi:hypothetical protein